MFTFTIPINNISRTVIRKLIDQFNDQFFPIIPYEVKARWIQTSDDGQSVSGKIDVSGEDKALTLQTTNQIDDALNRLIPTTVVFSFGVENTPRVAIEQLIHEFPLICRNKNGVEARWNEVCGDDYNVSGSIVLIGTTNHYVELTEVEFTIRDELARLAMKFGPIVEKKQKDDAWNKLTPQEQLQVTLLQHLQQDVASLFNDGVSTKKLKPTKWRPKKKAFGVFPQPVEVTTPMGVWAKGMSM